MITRDIPIRVRYYETDCMGFVHHSNYVRYYETARTEMLRELGMTYPELEAQADGPGDAGRDAESEDALRLRGFPRKRGTDQYGLGDAGVHECRDETGLPGSRLVSGAVEALFLAETFRAIPTVKQDGKRSYGRSFPSLFMRQNPGGPVDAAMVGSGFLFYPSDAVSTAYRPERPRMPVPPFACRRPVESGCRRL